MYVGNITIRDQDKGLGSNSGVKVALLLQRTHTFKTYQVNQPSLSRPTTGHIPLARRTIRLFPLPQSSHQSSSLRNFLSL